MKSQEWTSNGMTLDKKVFREGPYSDFFAEGVQVGNILYLSGQVAIDAAGHTPDGIVEQTKLAYWNIQRVLERFDAEMLNIVDETIYVTDMEEFFAEAEAVYSIRQNAYGGSPEVCQTLIQVASLAFPELKIEVKCVAHLSSVIET